MKSYRICGIALLLMVFTLISCDIYKFLHGYLLSFYYPILPFKTYPSDIRGTGRVCYSMEGIIGFLEYTDECAIIEDDVDRTHDIDSLCIYSVSQYAWKRDTLLIAVSLEDGSEQWLCASPSLLEEYKCQLKKIDTPDTKYLSSFHLVHLKDEPLVVFLNKYNQNLRVILLGTLITLYFGIIIGVLVLHVICIVFAIMKMENIGKERNILWKIFYISVPFVPIVIFAILIFMRFSGSPLFLLP